MAYSDIAMLSADNDFILRTRACAATEGEADPVKWSQDNQWAMAATPGFGDKYASAVAGGVQRPGNDPSVISDPDILSAVQAIRSPA